jgi:hypothetical protein
MICLEKGFKRQWKVSRRDQTPPKQFPLNQVRLFLVNFVHKFFVNFFPPIFREIFFAIFSEFFFTVFSEIFFTTHAFLASRSYVAAAYGNGSLLGKNWVGEAWLTFLQPGKIETMD